MYKDKQKKYISYIVMNKDQQIVIPGNSVKVNGKLLVELYVIIEHSLGAKFTL